MRVFAGLLGGLFLVLGVVAGGADVLVINHASSSGEVTCTSSQATPGVATCVGNGAGDSQGHATGVAVAIGAAGLFVGGCALLGGAAAGSARKPAATPTYSPQPPVSAGPPSY